MKTALAVAVAAMTTLFAARGDARDVRTSFSFVVTIDDRPWTYNDTLGEDVDVLMAPNSPWHCVRTRVTLSEDGSAKGSLTCSSDGNRTSVAVSATCGLAPDDVHHVAELDAGDVHVELRANCVTVIYDRSWMGF